MTARESVPRVRVVAEDLWFPEGPVWVGDGSLLVVEIRRKTLTRIWPDGRKHVVATLGGGPNGAAMGPDGYCYVANNGGFAFTQRADGRWITAGTPDDYVTGRIERVNIDTGKFETIYDRIGDATAGEASSPGPLSSHAHRRADSVSATYSVLPSGDSPMPFGLWIGNTISRMKEPSAFA